MIKNFQTSERVSPTNLSDNFVFQRSLLAYKLAANIVNGVVLEIGTGEGYGVFEISPEAEFFITIDKKRKQINQLPSNVLSLEMEVPKLDGISNNSIDYVISFQVIEHIKNDKELINEIHRVLKIGGKLIISTPNKIKSLTRNPWHIREYTSFEFEKLLKEKFNNIEKLGIIGNEKINSYYHENRVAIKKIKRFDVFNFMDILPRKIILLPYDVLNRLNRLKLLKTNFSLCSNIKIDDYFLKDVCDDCFDLFFIAEKTK